jgi:hypothetical protein
MTLSLFQKYELRKNRYKPGTVWIDKESYHTVRILQILALYEYEGVSDVFRLYQGESNLFFRVLKSSGYRGGSLCKDTIVSWSTEYMEQYYEPLLDD